MERCEVSGILTKHSLIILRSSAAFCDARQIMAIDNGETGFDVCDINKCGLTRHFPLKANSSNARLPTQVAFAEGAGIIVGGSDHGVAYIFDRRSGAIVDTLYHALDGDTFVRTVSASVLHLY